MLPARAMLKCVSLVWHVHTIKSLLEGRFIQLILSGADCLRVLAGQVFPMALKTLRRWLCVFRLSDFCDMCAVTPFVSDCLSFDLLMCVTCVTWLAHAARVTELAHEQVVSLMSKLCQHVLTCVDMCDVTHVYISVTQSSTQRVVSHMSTYDHEQVVSTYAHKQVVSTCVDICDTTRCVGDCVTWLSHV